MRLRKPSSSELDMLRGIADYQFGYPAGDLLLEGDIVVGVSPATRRIREVYGSEGLLAVLRAHDYFYSLTLRGARRLLRLEWPRLRVVVREPAVVVRKTLYCSDIVLVDSGLYAGDEVIVVDRSDRLVGVGRLRLAPSEIAEGVCRSEAVRLRKTVKE